MPLFFRQRPRTRRVSLNKVLPVSNSVGQSELEPKNILPTALIWMALTAATVALINLGNPPIRYTLGDTAEVNIYARAAFKYVDEKATERLRTQAAERVLDVYQMDGAKLFETHIRLKKILNDIEATGAEADKPQKDKLSIPSELLAALKTDLAKKEKSAVRAGLREVFGQIAELGLIAADDFLKGQRILVLGHLSGDAVVTDVEDLLRPATLGTMIREKLQAGLKRSLSGLVEPMADWLERNVKPTLVYDEESTKEYRARARQETPVKEVSFAKNDLLFAAGTSIESAQISLLMQEQTVYLRELSGRTRYFARRFVGVALMIVLTYGVGLAYLVRYQHPILRSPVRLAVLAMLILLMVVIARLCVQLRASHYLVPVSLLTVWLALAHDRRFALTVSLFVLIPVTVTLGNDYGALIVLLLGTLTAALLTVHINRRTKLIVVGFMVGLIQVIGIWAIGLIEQTQLGVLLQHSLFGLGNGLFVGFLVTGTLPFLERAFHITTEISLLELADLNQPILKSLALEAPGTYNHSLTVGVLAEAAAEAIGADDMLVRVGSYYHDIGKLNKPEYFIENAHTATQRHENLSPTMSTLIIIAHVKDGLEMAEELGLPRAVRDILTQHHGTTLVEFFYKKHREEQSGDEAETLDDVSFRYPGPKPKTAEAVVVMLADAAESASRTLSEPTPGSIENLVGQIIQNRLNDEQFSECSITLDELHRIERALVKGLNSIYHSRVRY